jgi:hypothetical protein
MIHRTGGLCWPAEMTATNAPGQATSLHPLLPQHLSRPVKCTGCAPGRSEAARERRRGPPSKLCPFYRDGEMELGWRGSVHTLLHVRFGKVRDLPRSDQLCRVPSTPCRRSPKARAAAGAATRHRNCNGIFAPQAKATVKKMRKSDLTGQHPAEADADARDCYTHRKKLNATMRPCATCFPSPDCHAHRGSFLLRGKSLDPEQHTKRGSVISGIDRD